MAKNRQQPKSRPVHTCELIFEKLKCADKELHSKLNEVITPQLFFLKWLRLVCAREFHIKDTIIILDNVIMGLDEPVKKDTKTNLVYKPLPEIICKLGIALVLSARGALMRGNEMEILETLMRFQYPRGGGLNKSTGSYNVVGAPGINSLFDVARGMRNEPKADLPSFGATASNAFKENGGRKQHVASAVVAGHHQEDISNADDDSDGVVSILTKTSSSIMSAISSKVEDTGLAPAWLMRSSNGAESVTAGDPEPLSLRETASSLQFTATAPGPAPAPTVIVPEPEPIAPAPSSKEEAVPAIFMKAKERAKNDSINTKSTLDFLIGRETKSSRDVFGTFDDSESDDNVDNDEEEAKMVDENGMEEQDAVEQDDMRAVQEPTLAQKAEPVSDFDPVQSEAPLPPLCTNNDNEDSMDLSTALGTIKSYLQGEGAGAPRKVWVAFEALEKKIEK